MHHKHTSAIAGAAILITLSCTAGCGSASSGSSGSGSSALQCSFETYLDQPVHRQLVADSSVDCNFPVATSKTTLVIQAKRTGTPATDWDNVDDPKSTTQVPPTEMTYTVVCVGGLDYQASADITGVATDGQPFHADETTDVATYTQAECNQS